MSLRGMIVLPTYSPLLTDFYQLTMAYGYWKLGMHEQTACFHLLFRRNPFKGKYAISCGLESLLDFLSEWQFQQDDLDYLQRLKNTKGERHFSDDFLTYLATLRFTCHLDAIEEGSLVFPNTPLLRLEGPLLQCQLIESPLLNIINFQTLIATKASRVCRAADGQSVIEFGMRRAQGPDGAISASRASYIGGCHATANTLAGKYYDIPVKGTHAHSWVTAFPSEHDAFAAYAEVMPDNCILLVDTFDTINGVKNAINIGLKLREHGSELLGIRLDSGDMAELSIKARTLLDQAGLTHTAILASNSLDEYVITDLKSRGAKINVWGVGTNLTTAYDQPALDGVYKLAAIKNKNHQWEYKLKLSEENVKTSNPGRHQIRRFMKQGQIIADVVYDLDLGIDNTGAVHSMTKPYAKQHLTEWDETQDLLQPILAFGKRIKAKESIHQIRERAIKNYTQAELMDSLNNYPVFLEQKLSQLKQNLIKNSKQR